MKNKLHTLKTLSSPINYLVFSSYNLNPQIKFTRFNGVWFHWLTSSPFFFTSIIFSSCSLLPLSNSTVAYLYIRCFLCQFLYQTQKWHVFDCRKWTVIFWRLNLWSRQGQHRFDKSSNLLRNSKVVDERVSSENAGHCHTQPANTPMHARFVMLSTIDLQHTSIVLKSEKKNWYFLTWNRLHCTTILNL